MSYKGDGAVHTGAPPADWSKSKFAAIAAGRMGMRVGLLAVGCCAFGVVQPAGASVFTQLDLSGVVNRQIATDLIDPAFPTGSQSYTFGSAQIPFSIISNTGPSGQNQNNYWNADYDSSGNNPVGTITLTLNVAIPNATTAYTLMNTFWGLHNGGSDVSITFTDSAGDTYTKDLVGNSDIRDFNNSQTPVWANSINGTTTINVWNNAPPSDPQGTGTENYQRMDMQEYSLPLSFLGHDLTTITITDTGGNPISRAILFGAAVVSMPEPMTAISAIGLLGLILAGRRRRFK